MNSRTRLYVVLFLGLFALISLLRTSNATASESGNAASPTTDITAWTAAFAYGSGFPSFDFVTRLGRGLERHTDTALESKVKALSRRWIRDERAGRLELNALAGSRANAELCMLAAISAIELGDIPRAILLAQRAAADPDHVLDARRLLDALADLLDV